MYSKVQEELVRLIGKISPSFKEIEITENGLAVYELKNDFPVEKLEESLGHNGWAAFEIKKTGENSQLNIILELPEIFSKEQIEMAKPSKIDPEKQEILVKKGFIFIVTTKYGLQRFPGNGKVIGKKYATQVDITKPVSEWPGIARFTFSNANTRKEILDDILASKQGSGVVFLTDNRNQEPSILLILNEKCQKKVYSLVREKTESIKDVLKKNKIDIVGNFRKVSMHDLGVKVVTLKDSSHSSLAVKLITEQTKFSAKIQKPGEIVVSGLTHNVYHDNIKDFQQCCNEGKAPNLYTSTSLPTREDILKLLRERDHATRAPYPRINKDTGELMVLFREDELTKRQIIYDQFSRNGIQCHFNGNSSLIVTIVGTIPESERVVKTKPVPVQKQKKVPVSNVVVNQPSLQEIVTLLKVALTGKRTGIAIINNGEKIKIQVNGDKKMEDIRKIVDDTLVSEQFSTISARKAKTLFYVKYDEKKVIGVEKTTVLGISQDLQEIAVLLKTSLKTKGVLKQIRCIELINLLNSNKIKIRVKNLEDLFSVRKNVDVILFLPK